MIKQEPCRGGQSEGRLRRLKGSMDENAYKTTLCEVFKTLGALWLAVLASLQPSASILFCVVNTARGCGENTTGGYCRGNHNVVALIWAATQGRPYRWARQAAPLRRKQHFAVPCVIGDDGCFAVQFLGRKCHDVKGYHEFPDSPYLSFLG